MTLIARRKFLTGLIAAPLVVSYQNIMPVKLFVPDIVKVPPLSTTWQSDLDRYIYKLSGQNIYRYDINADTWQQLDFTLPANRPSSDNR
jgi:hypothetical protein